MYNFLFDVDGTLTPSRGQMDPQFRSWFLAWAEHRAVYLVTGSDYAKTVEQVGADICERITGVYNCAGNQFYRQGVLERTKTWSPTPEQRAYLERLLTRSPYPVKTGQHIEDRGCLTNFSIVGRSATPAERESYWDWDSSYGERIKLALLIKTEFPELDATVAGQTGIDIYPKGWDKGQIADDFTDRSVFFGDMTRPGGNDWSLAERVYRSHTVKDWRETWQILQDQYGS